MDVTTIKAATTPIVGIAFIIAIHLFIIYKNCNYIKISIYRLAMFELDSIACSIVLTISYMFYVDNHSKYIIYNLINAISVGMFVGLLTLILAYSAPNGPAGWLARGAQRLLAAMLIDHEN